ncbi:PolC-type DNA polymerase III [Lactococcus fujiensis]|uniref:DNA polymerase III PolC-type n=1 Tax=Lactococcus fujiensis JCM 16395 TaxID=1291764 RepID=A0A2A5RIH7_9LACT|nr:PolC-type DNA polymerase III [Lactococcus fujiensis]PCR98884.1 hypothetical protein RT41_GL000623 [Lactococcus fujiensis JCM 16395]
MDKIIENYKTVRKKIINSQIAQIFYDEILPKELHYDKKTDTYTATFNKTLLKSPFFNKVNAIMIVKQYVESQGKKFKAVFNETDLRDNDVIAEILKIERREINNKRGNSVIYNFNCKEGNTYFKATKKINVIEKNLERLSLYDGLVLGDSISIEGKFFIDSKLGENIFKIDYLEKVEEIEENNQEIELDYDEPYVELHLHTSMSPYRGLHTYPEMTKVLKHRNHKMVGVTDIENIQGFTQIKNSKRNGMDVFYGIQLALNDNQPLILYPNDSLLADNKYVVLDIETTGLNREEDKIIQIAAVKIENGVVIESFERLINPEIEVPQFIYDLTHLDPKAIENGVNIKEALNDFGEFCKGAVLVAHNAQFDIPFIRHHAELNQTNETYINHTVIDTMVFFQANHPELKKFSLEALTRFYHKKLDGHHNAVVDATSTAECFMEMLQEASNCTTLLDLMKIDTNHAAKRVNSYVSIIAKNQEGLKDLFQLITVAQTKQLYRTASISHSTLQKYRKNLFISSVGQEGEIQQMVARGEYAQAQLFMNFYDGFGLVPSSNYSYPEIYKGINAKVFQLVKDTKRFYFSNNPYLLDESEELLQEIMDHSIKIGNNLKGIHPNDRMVMRTWEEMKNTYLEEGMTEKHIQAGLDFQNTIIENLEKNLRVFYGDDELFTPVIEKSKEQIIELATDRMHELYTPNPPEYVIKRLNKELDSITSNGFDVIYLIARELVKRSNERGYIVGSRGSVGSSFTATMLGISNVNPLKPHWRCPNNDFVTFDTPEEVENGYDLPDFYCPNCGTKCSKEGMDIPFETFLGFNGDKVPDIDLNFAGEDQGFAQKDVRELFGEKFAYKAGTIMTIAEKSALQMTKSFFIDRKENVNSAYAESLAEKLVGTKVSTGTHAGGVIVIPQYKGVFDYTPFQFPAGDKTSDWKTTHFDFHSIHDNVLKLDILGHDDPRMIKELERLTQFDNEQIDLSDPNIPLVFSNKAVNAYGREITPTGLPEFGTDLTQKMLQKTQPKTVSDLFRISGLSHGTDVWTGNSEDLIDKGIATLKEVVACRDDIMLDLIKYGLPEKASFDIMEAARKGMYAKGKKSKAEPIALMKEHGVPDWYIESVMKIMYLFPKGHAVAYTINAMKIAWWKINYPSAFAAAWLTTKGEQFDTASFSLTEEEINAQIGRLKREIMATRTNADVKKKLVKSLSIQLDALRAGVTFKPVSLEHSSASRFEVDVTGAIIPPLTTISGLGAEAAQTMLDLYKVDPEKAQQMYQRKVAQANKADNKKVIKNLVFEQLLTKFIVKFGNKETYGTHYNKAFTKFFNKTYEDNSDLPQKEMVKVFAELISAELSAQ